MVVLSENGNKLIDCASVFIRPVKDSTDLNKIGGYKVCGCTLTGRNETLFETDSEENAKKALVNIADTVNKCTPVFYFNKEE